VIRRSSAGASGNSTDSTTTVHARGGASDTSGVRVTLRSRAPSCALDPTKGPSFAYVCSGPEASEWRSLTRWLDAEKCPAARRHVEEV
jgi:hypothetical protein